MVVFLVIFIVSVALLLLSGKTSGGMLSLINLIVTEIYGITIGFRFEPCLACIIGIYLVFLLLEGGY